MRSKQQNRLVVIKEVVPRRKGKQLGVRAPKYFARTSNPLKNMKVRRRRR